MAALHAGGSQLVATAATGVWQTRNEDWPGPYDVKNNAGTKSTKMSDENEQAEKTPETKSAKSGGLDFGAVIAKLKDLGSFLSLDGKASRSEYWATFLILWLPLALLSGVFTTLALVLDPKDFPNLLSYPMTLFIGLSSACLMFANLVMLPVLMRRLRDAKISPWLAVGCFALAVVPFPWFGYAGALAILAAGIFPSKADADGGSATGIAANAKMGLLMTLLLVLAAGMSGSMMAYFTAWFQERSVAKKIEKAMENASKELEKQSEKLKKEIEKDMGEMFGGNSFDDDDGFGGKRGKRHWEKNPAESDSRQTCIGIMKMLHDAGEQCLLMGKKPTPENLYGPNNYLRTEPRCPLGGRYRVSVDEERGGVKVTCPHADEGHVLPNE